MALPQVDTVVPHLRLADQLLGLSIRVRCPECGAPAWPLAERGVG